MLSLSFPLWISFFGINSQDRKLNRASLERYLFSLLSKLAGREWNFPQNIRLCWAMPVHSPPREDDWLLGCSQIKRKVQRNGNSGERGCQNVWSIAAASIKWSSSVCGINFMKDALIYVSLWCVGLDQQAYFKKLGKKRKKKVQSILLALFALR